MPSTSHPEFGASTEALDVAKAFGDGIRGKTVLVTGVNRGGIGFTTAEAFASQGPAHLIIASRTPSKMQECVDAMKSQFPNVDYRQLQVNLSSQESVRAAAAECLSWPDVPTIDIMVNSAGIMFIPERTLTPEGIELTFATNHIGHYLFVCLLIPKLIKAAEKNPKGVTRVVNVTSGSPTMARMRWSDMSFEKKSTDLPEAEQPAYQVHKMFGAVDPENATYLPLEGYNQSKVANVLFAIGLTKRLFEKHGILGVSVHPGVIVTELSRHAGDSTMAAVKTMAENKVFTYKTLGAGSSTSMVAALDPKLAENVGETKQGSENYGAFLMDCQVSSAAQPLAVSSSEAEKLWDLSESMVKEKFSW